MPRPRFANADAALQSRILEAATEEFATKGYEAASLNRILLKAGLSKGSFYYYFDDKADLAAATLATLIDDLRPVFDQLGEPKDAKGFWASLRNYAARTMDEGLGTQTRLDLVAKLGMAYVEHPEVAAQVLPRLQGFREQMVGFIKRGQKLKAVRSDLPAETLMSVMQGAKTSLAAAMIPREGVTRADIERFNDVYFDLIERMVKP